MLALLVSLALAVPAAPRSLAEVAPPGPGTVRVYVLRHGEAALNVDNPAGQARGPDHDRLTDRGRTQVDAAARALAGPAFESVYASPTGRTRDTARLLLPALGGARLRNESRLRPLELGKHPDGQRLSWQERAVEWKAGRDPVPPRGESLAQLRERLRDLLRDLAPDSATAPPRHVVLVTHGEVAAGLAEIGRDRPPMQGTILGVQHASITVLDVRPGGEARLMARDIVPWR